MLYRIDGGAWTALDHPPRSTARARSSHVEVVTNDRPGNYYDNTGAMSVTVVRTKA